MPCMPFQALFTPLTFKVLLALVLYAHIILCLNSHQRHPLWIRCHIILAILCNCYSYTVGTCPNSSRSHYLWKIRGTPFRMLQYLYSVYIIVSRVLLTDDLLAKEAGINSHFLLASRRPLATHIHEYVKISQKHQYSISTIPFLTIAQQWSTTVQDYSMPHMSGLCC